MIYLLVISTLFIMSGICLGRYEQRKDKLRREELRRRKRRVFGK